MSYPVCPFPVIPWSTVFVDKKNIEELRSQIKAALEKVGSVHISHDGYLTRAYLTHINIMLQLTYYQHGEQVRVEYARMYGARFSFIRAIDFFFHYLVGREVPSTWKKPSHGTLADIEETEDLNIGHKMTEDEVKMAFDKLSDGFSLQFMPIWIACDEYNRDLLLEKGIASELAVYLEDTGMTYERIESIVRAMDALRVPFDVSKWADITSDDPFDELRCREIRQRVENILQRV